MVTLATVLYVFTPSLIALSISSIMLSAEPQITMDAIELPSEARSKTVTNVSPISLNVTSSQCPSSSGVGKVIFGKGVLPVALQSRRTSNFDSSLQ